ncbi:hypothetical protein TWF594_004497 [Orbilia oligospora]|nr:hypothetical protein TWF594_004497 [Orbilia oligospora]
MSECTRGLFNLLIVAYMCFILFAYGLRWVVGQKQWYFCVLELIWYTMICITMIAMSFWHYAGEKKPRPEISSQVSIRTVYTCLPIGIAIL